MGMRSGVAFGLGVLLALGLVTGALAQPHPKPGKPAGAGKPKADAGSTDNNPYASEPAATAAPAGSGSAAAPSVEVAPHMVQGDGGAPKLSPLNPAANEFPDGGAPAETIDYDKLLADIAALRARVAAVSDNLFRSRIVIAVETSGDHGRIARLNVSLDDGVVYTSPQNFHAGDLTTVYDHAVAPGRHAITFEIERRDDRDESFRNTQRSRFIVDVPRDDRLVAETKIWDDSSMGGDFPGDRSGKYDLRIRLKAQAKPAGR
jgi:hypothetical protein